MAWFNGDFMREQHHLHQGMGLMSSYNRHLSLYLGYPCSVNAGVDPVEYTKRIVARITKLRERQREQEWQQLHEELCGLIPECSTNSTYEQLIENAGKLKGAWGYAVNDDKTMMTRDMNLVSDRSAKMGFTGDTVNTLLHIEVIDEYEDEHITNVQAFLSCIPDPQDGTIRFLCLCGHGLSEEAAANLCHHPADDGTKKSTVWHWDFRNCEKPDGMNQKASEMTGSAKKGDIVVFSSGLLTPEWVIGKLRGCEENLRLWILKRKKLRDCEKELRSKVQNTIVIVIDACYSGGWKARMQECLADNPLEFTRVILQTSCSENEVSYGCCFIPVFCALQDRTKHAKLLDAYKNNHNVGEIDELCDCTIQTPTIYDSNNAANSNGLPDCEQFCFLNDGNFLTFCLKYLTVSSLTNARGIPNSKIKLFLNSFATISPPTIRCFKLKKHKKSKSPLAFFLMKWKDGLYHIHLHFNDFTNMQLTGVSHVDVTDTDFREYYRYVEDEGTKCHINYSRHNPQWELVESNKIEMIQYCKEFVEHHGVQWDNEAHWNMKYAYPDDLIRSRSANFQKATEYIKWRNLNA